MKLSREDVLKLAKLSRLKLTSEEVEQYRTELSAILEYVEQLENAETEGLEPTYQVTGLTNVFRKDEVKDQVAHEELMKNAPDSENRQIKVKRMIG